MITKGREKLFVAHEFIFLKLDPCLVKILKLAMYVLYLTTNDVRSGEE